MEQHPGEVYYVQNDLETSVDYELDMNEDLKRIRKKAEKVEAGKHDTISNLDVLKNNLRDAVKEMKLRGNPVKILVTYDSFRHVRDALEQFYIDGEGIKNIFKEFQVVVDEFQSIFIDSHFKSDTEIELLDNLKDVKKVCYVSATPILDKYLEKLNSFKDLPYYEFNWEKEEPERVVKPKLEIRFTVSNLTQAVNTVIGSYINGNFETRIDPKTKNFIESKEVVLFFNSVGGICQAIRSNDLSLNDCNILCARSTRNQDLLRKAFNNVIKKRSEESGKTPKYFTKNDDMIGKIPTKGKPHKMFTFCTRTVYLGADFYSTCARTFIFSDSNIDCLSVDISMDLEQIIGRQRLDENPWKNTAVMYVKTTKNGNKKSKEEFDSFLDKKVKFTNNLLSSYKKSNSLEKEDLIVVYQDRANDRHYRTDYVAVTRIKDENGVVVRLQPVFNDLVFVTEQRAFELQQTDYADRFSVFSSVKSKDINSADSKIIEGAEEFNSLSRSTDKLKYLLEFTSSEGISKEEIEVFLELIPGKYKDYYTVVGPEIIKAQGCKEADIKKEWRRIKTNGEVEETVVSEIYKTFLIGKRYTKKEIKDTLSKLYQKLGYEKKAKSTDLDLLYILKPILTPDKKAGFEIIGKR